MRIFRRLFSANDTPWPDPLASVVLPGSARIDLATPRTIRQKLGSEWTVEVLVPVNLMEWFVTIFAVSTGEEVWHDWMDYTGYSDGPEDPVALSGVMAADIQWFLTQMDAAKAIRITPKKGWFGLRIAGPAEWRQAETWSPIVLTRPTTSAA
jgi:hypothetical protein